MTNPDIVPPESLSYWEDYWNQKRQASYLKQTQILAPEKWQIFYDRVSGLWPHMTGSSQATNEKIADFMIEHRLCTPGDAVLDIGCGPGVLSFALAARGMTVTALDNSAGMIQQIQEKIRRGNICGIRTQLMDWRHLPPEPGHDLALACCFPDAFSPSGLARMESFAAKKCLLVFGSGKDVFPLRRQIWEKVMDIPLPETSTDNVLCAENYLRAAGRDTVTQELSLPVHLDTDIATMESFYREYFAIFGKTGPDLHQAVAEVLAEYAAQARIQMTGHSQPRLVWWEPLLDRPIPCVSDP